LASVGVFVAKPFREKAFVDPAPSQGSLRLA